MKSELQPAVADGDAMFFSLKPAPPKPELPEDRIDSTYRLLREQVFLGTFIGYAGYYLVRKNISLANSSLMTEYGYTEAQLGFAASAIALSYGLSKFVMGNVSDRSNARKFLTLGLVLTASINIFLGFFHAAFSSIALIYGILFLNGWVQGMGWAPCGRSMVHWFSRSERGTRMAVWNVAHNVGAGLVAPLTILAAVFFGPESWRMNIFFFPALCTFGIAAVTYLLMRDTPQSCGLPSIEHYKNEFPENYSESHEKELTPREIFFSYVFNNKFLWAIAFANAFVYLVRYGVIDWVPLYLERVKEFSKTDAKWAFFACEYAGIPGTLLCGWMSDKLFRGKRGPATILFMLLVMAAIAVYWLCPPGYYWITVGALIAFGFLIYGPVMLIGLHALELVPKKAAGTAAGLTGLLGYFVGTQLAGFGIGFLVTYSGWDAAYYSLICACLLACLFAAWTVLPGTKRKESETSVSG